MALLDDAKMALRIASATTAFDGEVADLIEAARADLIDSGVAVAVAKAETPEPIIKRAILVYCKAHFGFDNPDADRLQVIYDRMVQKIGLIAEYREAADAVESGA